MKELILKALKEFNLPVDDKTVLPFWLDKDDPNSIMITTQINPIGDRQTIAVLKKHNQQYIISVGLDIITTTDNINIALTEMISLYFKYICLGYITIHNK